MSASTINPTRPLRSDEQPLAQYRAVSRTAILAAGLGLASGLVLATPLLAPLPIAAVITSILAFREISRSGGQIVGRSAAILGLGLATLFLGCSLTRHFSRTMYLEAQARQIADAYLGLIKQGKPREALQFRQSSSMRIYDPQALADRFEKDPEAVKELQTFVTSQVVQDLQQLGAQAKVNFDRVTTGLHDGFTDRLVLQYSYERPGENREQQSFWLHVTRRFEESSKRSEWEVSSTEMTPPKGTE